MNRSKDLIRHLHKVTCDMLDSINEPEEFDRLMTEREGLLKALMNSSDVAGNPSIKVIQQIETEILNKLYSRQVEISEKLKGIRSQNRIMKKYVSRKTVAPRFVNEVY